MIGNCLRVSKPACGVWLKYWKIGFLRTRKPFLGNILNVSDSNRFGKALWVCYGGNFSLSVKHGMLSLLEILNIRLLSLD